MLPANLNENMPQNVGLKPHKQNFRNGEAAKLDSRTHSANHRIWSVQVKVKNVGQKGPRASGQPNTKWIIACEAREAGAQK